MRVSLASLIYLTLAVSAPSATMATSHTDDTLDAESRRTTSLRGGLSSTPVDPHHRELVHILYYSDSSSRGKVNLDQPCDKHVQCKVNQYCKDNKCQAQASQYRVCNNKGDAYCQSWNCAAPAPEYRHLYAQGTQLCSRDPKDNSNNVGRGGNCQTDTNCNESQDYCGLENDETQTTCKGRKTVDSVCGRDSECKSNRCLGSVCVDPTLYPLDPGSSLKCEFDSDCKSGDCTSGVCGGYRLPGETCKMDSHCSGNGFCGSDGKCECPNTPTSGSKYYIHEYGNTNNYLFMHGDSGSPDYRICARPKKSDKAWRFSAHDGGLNTYGYPIIEWKNRKRNKFLATVSDGGETIAAGLNAGAVTSKWVMEPDDQCNGFYFKYFGDYLSVTGQDWGDDHNGRKVVRGPSEDRTLFVFEFQNYV